MVAPLASNRERNPAMHIETYLNGGDLPLQCIMDCSQPGIDVVPYIERWRQELDLTVDRWKAVAHLRNTGSWTDRDLAGMTDNDVAEAILWLACIDIKCGADGYDLEV